MEVSMYISVKTVSSRRPVTITNIMVTVVPDGTIGNKTAADQPVNPVMRLETNPKQDNSLVVRGDVF